MTPSERRTALSLAGIYSFRMLGLFMILPVFAIYAEGLAGATPTLIGLAIGIYGLTQGLLQIPFGTVSDRIGRKPVIITGLILFALGSVVAAVSDNIYGVIAGRALQGAGAIAAAIMALAADLTREEHRIKVNAIIGMSIGASFSAAMVLGPLLDKWVGVSGIFWLTSVLAIGGIAILMFRVPTPVESRRHRDAETVPEQLKEVVRNRQLLRLDFGIFTLHMVLTSVFVVVPLMLRDEGLASDHHWQVYLPVMLLSIAAMVPFIILAEKKRRIKEVFVGAIVVLLLAILGLMNSVGSLAATVVALWLYFAAFNLLEASLPSLIAKTAPPQSKGTAMGVYSSAQFIGVFIGGVVGGSLYGQFGVEGVFLFDTVLILMWLVLAASMQKPQFLSSYILNVGSIDASRARDLSEALREVRGVAEAVVLQEDGLAYLKVDNKALDKAALLRFSAGESV
ncbi:MAG: MFS transporter [Gammaproteobacteria bacterium]|nr:MFS transporter [Gammaproteobacteria bacterium]